MTLLKHKKLPPPSIIGATLHKPETSGPHVMLSLHLLDGAGNSLGTITPNFSEEDGYLVNDQMISIKVNRSVVINAVELCSPDGEVLLSTFLTMGKQLTPTDEGRFERGSIRISREAIPALLGCVRTEYVIQEIP